MWHSGRLVYVQMTMEQGTNPKRPFDMAVSEYYHHSNDLLWKKHKSDQEKPKNWQMGFYTWYFRKQKLSK